MNDMIAAGPAEIAVGTARADLDTPALLVDLDVLTANIAAMAAVCRQAGVAWRPHTKGVKTPEIALMEVAAGAIGITCAKLGEAEVMAAGGIRDILIANQIVGPQKAKRLAALLAVADVKTAVDSVENAQALSAAMVAAGRRLKVLIEVDTGMQRAGVQPGAATVALAQAIAALPGLEFAGIMGWEAQCVAIADPAAKAAAIAEAIGRLTASAAACTAVGLPCAIISCGGTGTFPMCAQQPGITEVQAGGGIFSDVLYRRIFKFDGPQALTVLATVTSRPTPTRIIFDAGKKTMSSDAAVPEAIGIAGVVALKLSAEHGTIELAAPSASPAIGEKVEMIVGYSDTTVHLHETILAMRGGRVAAAWRVAGRGRLS